MTAYALLRRIAKTVKPIQGICQGVFPIVELEIRLKYLGKHRLQYKTT